MRNRQGIQKSSLVEEESDMKRNEFEALALLRRRVKEMRANGEMDAQHDAGAATQLEEKIEEESRDFKSSFCEFRNKRRQTKFIVRAIPNRTNQIHCAGDTERIFEGAVCSNGF